MQFHFVDLNQALVEAWQRVFADVPDVRIHHGSVFDMAADALVSPANSFGYMNGGIDFAISKNLGWHIEKRLQNIIRSRHHGELLVGQAEIVPTDHAQFPWLISAPTMRTPMTIARTPNVYLAMKAILILLADGKMEDGSPVRQHVQSIAIPGLGTGIGKVPALDCARYMRLAWEDIQGKKYLEKGSWEEMNSNFIFLHTGDPKYLKYKIP